MSITTLDEIEPGTRLKFCEYPETVFQIDEAIKAPVGQVRWLDASLFTAEQPGKKFRLVAKQSDQGVVACLLCDQIEGHVKVTEDEATLDSGVYTRQARVPLGQEELYQYVLDRQVFVVYINQRGEMEFWLGHLVRLDRAQIA